MTAWGAEGMTSGFLAMRRHALRDVRLVAAALLACAALPVAAATPAATETAPKPRTMGEILDASKPSDWRPLVAENTLYVQLDSGRVVIELAPAFAPLHAANIRKLVRAGYFDGLPIVRSQDNYVVQWGDPDGKRSLGDASGTLPPEFTVAWTPALPFTVLPDVDGYAPQVGFSDGFPAGRDPKTRQAWLAHCYGMVGVGRGNELDSGNGSELYVVIGNAPRHLDRNIALVGRVVEGMELLSTLPRGSGPLGFYEKPEQYVPIRSIRLAADVPAAERPNLEVIRTDTATFEALVESRRNRRDDWYKVPAGYVELCNVPIVVRSRP
ncbi:MAG TPA: peptidylprolyl isomerase [Steroidobacteraceae bacterium]|nr:peptidylprolyl isomerase [Steroidobacteraceae bacterium]HQR48365.1 peptidylprolyl isomerase [Steroidobacteraceae bacterium]